MNLTTIFILITFVFIALFVVIWQMYQHYKKLVRFQKDVERLYQQKCAFIQAQERAASITRHRIKL